MKSANVNLARTWFSETVRQKRCLSFFYAGSNIATCVTACYISLIIYWSLNVLLNMSFVTVLSGTASVSFFSLFLHIEMQSYRSVALHQLVTKGRKPKWFTMAVLRRVDPELREHILNCHLVEMHFHISDIIPTQLNDYCIPVDEDPKSLPSFLMRANRNNGKVYVPFIDESAPVEYALVTK